jgi:hypothetical protein
MSEAGYPAHRDTSSACTSFLAALVVPTPPGEANLAFGGGSNEIRGSPRLDPGLVPHFKLGASPQTDQEASMEQFVHQQNIAIFRTSYQSARSTGYDAVSWTFGGNMKPHELVTLVDGAAAGLVCTQPLIQC